jgi:hypothetical protein
MPESFEQKITPQHENYHCYVSGATYDVLHSSNVLGILHNPDEITAMSREAQATDPNFGLPAALGKLAFVYIGESEASTHDHGSRTVYVRSRLIENTSLARPRHIIVSELRNRTRAAGKTIFEVPIPLGQITSNEEQSQKVLVASLARRMLGIKPSTQSEEASTEPKPLFQLLKGIFGHNDKQEEHTATSPFAELLGQLTVNHSNAVSLVVEKSYDYNDTRVLAHNAEIARLRTQFYTGLIGLQGRLPADLHRYIERATLLSSQLSSDENQADT